MKKSGKSVIELVEMLGWDGLGDTIGWCELGETIGWDGLGETIGWCELGETIGWDGLAVNSTHTIISNPTRKKPPRNWLNFSHFVSI